MVLTTPVKMHAYSPQKMHVHSCTRACATGQKLLCHGSYESSYCELILSLVRASPVHRAGCRLPPALLPARRNQSPDAIRSIHPSEYTLAHDAVAAAVSHKHHSIIRVGAGLIYFIYGSHSESKRGHGSDFIKNSIFAIFFAGLSHTAICCITLHHTASRCITLQNAATYGSTLQHTATHCNMLQHVATHCNPLQHSAALCSIRQHTATQCDTLQHETTRCNTKLHAETQCNIMQQPRDCNTQQHTTRQRNTVTQHHTATCFSMLSSASAGTRSACRNRHRLVFRLRDIERRVCQNPSRVATLGRTPW